MRLLIHFFLLGGLCVSGFGFEPTENREWSATSGHKIQASAVSVKKGEVSLEKSSGGVIKVPLGKLIQADQDFLIKHFKIGELSDSGVAKATQLAHPQGVVVGPVSTSEGSQYFLYLPTSLKQGRKAPLLFCSLAGGGTKRALQNMIEGAELCGFVMAVSLESKNKQATVINGKHCKASLKHILETLPVDDSRVYFSGNSGGGAMAFINASELKTEGVMPHVAYIPSGVEPQAKDYFIIGGGMDYNRYASAVARAKFGKKATHRMHPGGHQPSPKWMMVDGLIWFEARYLKRNTSDCEDEIKDFNFSMLAWLEEKKLSEAHRAYSTARFLMDEYKMSGSAKPKLQKILDELKVNPVNVSYYEGLQDIDELSENVLSRTGGGSQKKHFSPEAEKAAKRLLPKYRGVPIIEDTLKAIASPTV